MTRQIITVDIAPEEQGNRRLAVSQYDTGRPLGVRIVRSGEPVDCSGYTVQLYIYKPDRTYYEAEITADPDDSGLIIWETDEQQVAAAGACIAEIRLSEDGVSVGTANFAIWVEGSPSDLSWSSESESKSLIDLVDRAEAAADTSVASTVAAAQSAQNAQADAERAEAARGAAETASESAGSSATAAGQSATAAGQSATAAGQSATAAGQSASAAAGSASSASQSETAAGQSASSAAQSASSASQSATSAGQSASEAVQNAEAARQSATSAWESANSAGQSASDANSNAMKSEGYAVGKQNGTDVPSTSPYYQKNAKYYAEYAEQVADSIPDDYSDLAENVSDLNRAITPDDEATTQLSFYKATEYSSEKLIDNAKNTGTQTNPVVLSAGDFVKLTVTTTGDRLTMRLKNGDDVVYTIIEDSNHQATENEVFTFVCPANATALLTYSLAARYVTLETLSVKDGEIVDKDGNVLPVSVNLYASKSVETAILLKDRETVYDTLLSKTNVIGGTQDFPCNIAAGTKLKFTVTTLREGLVIRLVSNNQVVDTVINEDSQVATSGKVIEYTSTFNCDTVRLWTKGKFDLSLQVVNRITGKMKSLSGESVGIDIEQITGIKNLYDYQLLANVMVPNNGKLIKGLFIDCARKYFTPENLEAIMDMMGDANLNVLYLHFSENEGFRFGLDDMIVHANGTTYDLSTALGKGIYAYGTPEDNDNYITQTEMDALISYANNLGITIIPSFDMPSHMGAILDKFPMFKSVGSTHSLNIGDSLAVNFAYAILEKYLDYFKNKGCTMWCLGADEVHGYDFTESESDANDFVNFCNNAIERILLRGMLPMMFNDNIGIDNIGDRIMHNIVVLYWQRSHNIEALTIANMGYRMVNMNSGFYYILGGSNSFDPSTMDIYRFSGNASIRVNESKGGNLSVWCSQANNEQYGKNDGGDYIVENIESYISAFGTGMNGQRKKVTVAPTEDKVFAANGIDFFNVDIGNYFTLGDMIGASISGKDNLMYVGYSNNTCKTEPIKSQIYGGTIRVWFVNKSNESVSVSTNNSITIEFM